MDIEKDNIEFLQVDELMDSLIPIIEISSQDRKNESSPLIERFLLNSELGWHG